MKDNYTFDQVMEILTAYHYKMTGMSPYELQKFNPVYFKQQKVEIGQWLEQLSKANVKFFSNLITK